MTNPLDEHLHSFQTTMDAIKIVRRVLDQRKNPLAKTSFYGLPQDEGHEILDQAEEQLNKLVAFVLFTAFERTLRDHLSSNLTPILESSTVPEQLSENLHEFLSNGVDRWAIDQVIQMFSPPAADQEVNNALNIRTFRHSVAHGGTPPNAIPPKTAYLQLTEFLRNTGLIP